MHPVGFEPTPPKRIELESIALDHSATDAYLTLIGEPTARFELATPCLRNRCTNHYAMLAGIRLLFVVSYCSQSVIIT